MGTVGAVKNYVESFIRESEPGYKIMLMDRETVSILCRDNLIQVSTICLLEV